MRFWLLILSITLLSWTSNLLAQNIQIRHIDANEFPTIRLTVEIPDTTTLNINELRILENNEPSFFAIDSIFLEQDGIAICLLLDHTILTQNSTKELFLNICQETFASLTKLDLFNVIITKKDSIGGCIQALSFEFTSDFKNFMDYIKDKFQEHEAGGKTKLNMQCAVDESLDFMQKKNLFQGKKYLIVINQTNNFEINQWELLKAKANEYLINLERLDFPVYNNLESTPNMFQAVLSEKTDSLEAIISKKPIKKNKTYIVSFTTTQSGKQNKFILQYKEKNISASFSSPDDSAFLKDNFLTILIIVLLIAFFTIIILYLKKQMNLSVKKLGSATKNENKIKAPFDPNKTLYGSKNFTPFVTVEMEGNIEKHELKKLRTTIGRHSDNDILIAHLTISNHHATLTNEGGVFYIQDNKSTNGTFVNEIKIDKSVVKTGDNVRLGKAKLVLTY